MSTQNPGPAHAQKMEDGEGCDITRESITFLAHDLRTSVHVIMASAELLLDGIPTSIPDAARQGVERIRSAAVRLSSDFDDLLLQMSISAGSTRLRISQVDLCLLLREVLAELHPLCAIRGLSMQFTDELRKSVVDTDAAKLRRVLTNLLANAIKFTDTGSVGLHARNEGGETVIRVVDTGPGIQPEDLPHLFTAYWRGGSQDRIGSGLGLAIASGLITVLGGSIQVESTVGSGSTFEVRLPAPVANAVAA